MCGLQELVFRLAFVPLRVVNGGKKKSKRKIDSIKMSWTNAHITYLTC